MRQEAAASKKPTKVSRFKEANEVSRFKEANEVCGFKEAEEAAASCRTPTLLRPLAPDAKKTNRHLRQSILSTQKS